MWIFRAKKMKVVKKKKKPTSDDEDDDDYEVEKKPKKRKKAASDDEEYDAKKVRLFKIELHQIFCYCFIFCLLGWFHQNFCLAELFIS